MKRRHQRDRDPPPKRRWTEFECPVCDANNPCDDGFRIGDEILCYYCGVPLQVEALEGTDRYRLKGG